MPETWVLGVFVKAPVAGRVKTRLAADIGPVRAVALYRRLGKEVVTAVVGDAYETAVWYAPRGQGSLVRDWLGGLGVTRFHAQPGGPLGRRLHAALARHFGEGAHRVIMIGSDCPAVDRPLIRQAFAALDHRDLVLGPAWDGGYYLIGMKTFHAPLFRGIHWSSATVLAQTCAHARALGLSYYRLHTLRDIDTVTDARAVGLMADAQHGLAPADGLSRR